MDQTEVISVRLRSAVVRAAEKEAARQNRNRSNLIEFFLIKQLDLKIGPPSKRPGIRVFKHRQEPVTSSDKYKNLDFT